MKKKIFKVRNLDDTDLTDEYGQRLSYFILKLADFHLIAHFAELQSITIEKYPDVSKIFKN